MYILFWNIKIFNTGIITGYYHDIEYLNIPTKNKNLLEYLKY